MERIVVYEGDTAESLAKAFCQKNQLNSEMEEKLVIMLDQQIAGVLPKIDENEEVSGEENDMDDTKPYQLNSANINEEKSPKRYRNSHGSIDLSSKATSLQKNSHRKSERLNEENKVHESINDTQPFS